jgi:hypothetical protein
MKVSIGPYSRKSGTRRVNVHIDDSDIWNLDHTLALIILPALQKMKDAKKGAPFVDDEDVPFELRSINAKSKENEWDIDEFWFDRWDHVIQVMIDGFSEIVNDGVNDHTVDDKKVRDGLRLFGKYFRGLWC